MQLAFVRLWDLSASTLPISPLSNCQALLLPEHPKLIPTSGLCLERASPMSGKVAKSQLSVTSSDSPRCPSKALVPLATSCRVTLFLFLFFFSFFF